LHLHLICDNYAVHKTEPVHKWLVAHPRFHLPFVWTKTADEILANLANYRTWRIRSLCVPCIGRVEGISAGLVSRKIPSAQVRMPSSAIRRSAL
jgi:hypothetical protein